MSFFGLECRLYQTGWKWIERWKDMSKHRASVHRSLQKPEVKESRRQYRIKYVKTEGYKNWLKSQSWYKESARRRTMRYNHSEHGMAKKAEYLSRPEVQSARRQRATSRRSKQKTTCPILVTVNNAIYETSRIFTNLSGVQYHVDHIIPISRGGLHVPWNLNPIPWHENLRKYNKLLTA